MDKNCLTRFFSKEGFVVDKFSIVYLVFVCLGGGTLAPWNIIVNVFDYFNTIWPNTGLDNSITLAYSFSQLPISFLMVRYGDYIHYNVRICVSLICLTAVLIAMPLVPELLPTEQGYYALIGLAVLIGIFGSVLQASVYGFANMFDSPRYAQGVMLGQAVNGVLVSFFRIYIKYSTNDSIDALYSSSKVFFASGWGFMGFCIVSYIGLQFHPYVIEKLNIFELAAGKEEETQHLTASTSMAEEGVYVAETSTDDDDVVDQKPSSHHKTSLTNMFRELWKEALSVYLVFATTFAVFPSVIFSLKYSGGFGDLTALVENGWWPIILVAIFNIFDTLGRVLASYLIDVMSSNVLLALTAFKALTIIPFILAKHGVVGDVVVVVNMVILSLSNGTFCTLAMIFGQKDVAANEREVAGFLMSLMLLSGIVSGAMIAYGVQLL